MNRQQEERRGEGDIVDDACRAELPHQERFSPLIKAEEGQHAGEEAAVDGVFQQVQHPEDEVRAERENRRRHLIFCAAGDEQVQREECAALQDETEVRHRHFRTTVAAMTVYAAAYLPSTMPDRETGLVSSS